MGIKSQDRQPGSDEGIGVNAGELKISCLVANMTFARLLDTSIKISHGQLTEIGQQSPYQLKLIQVARFTT